jgi:hypothetical protein
MVGRWPGQRPQKDAVSHEHLCPFIAALSRCAGGMGASRRVILDVRLGSHNEINPDKRALEFLGPRRITVNAHLRRFWPSASKDHHRRQYSRNREFTFILASPMRCHPERSEGSAAAFPTPEPADFPVADHTLAAPSSPRFALPQRVVSLTRSRRIRGCSSDFQNGKLPHCRTRPRCGIERCKRPVGANDVSPGQVRASERSPGLAAK